MSTDEKTADQAAETVPPAGAEEQPEAPEQIKTPEQSGKEQKESSGKEEKTGKAGKAEKKVADLEAQVEKLQKELAQTKDQYQRVLAEYANYKRRTEQEKQQIGQFTKAELLSGLLTSLDNMEKAVAAPAGDEYKAGVDLTMRQFADALHKLGLEEIPAEGAPFDPNVHHAVMREDADGVEADTVTEVYQKGYIMGDRVLRPAMVKVAN